MSYVTMATVIYGILNYEIMKQREKRKDFSQFPSRFVSFAFAYPEYTGI